MNEIKLITHNPKAREFKPDDIEDFDISHSKVFYETDINSLITNIERQIVTRSGAIMLACLVTGILVALIP